MFLLSFLLNLIHNKKTITIGVGAIARQKLQSDDALPMRKTCFRIIFLLSVIFQIKKEKRKDKHTKQKKRQSSHENCRFFGGPSGTRTPDRPVMSRML
jgi:hypothetical protein